jgi:hypothetical protein
MPETLQYCEESTPARAPTVHSDVTTPLLGALVGAGIATLIAGALCIAYEWSATVAGVTFLLFLSGGWIAWTGAAHATRWATKMTPLPPDPEPPAAMPQRQGVGMDAFVRACAAAGTDWRRWQGEPRYEEFRDALIARGYAYWNHPTERRQGWSLADMPADAICQAMAWYEWAINSPTLLGRR